MNESEIYINKANIRGKARAAQFQNSCFAVLNTSLVSLFAFFKRKSFFRLKKSDINWTVLTILVLAIVWQFSLVSTTAIIVNCVGALCLVDRETEPHHNWMALEWSSNYGSRDQEVGWTTTCTSELYQIFPSWRNYVFNSAVTCSILSPQRET